MTHQKQSAKAYQAAKLTDWERHEAKYVIHPNRVPAIREFLKPFCVTDPHGHGEHPAYTVTTLQLDSPDLALYHAKEDETLNRFKLRIRTYGMEPGHSRVYLEIKRKIKHVVAKTRTTIPGELWDPSLLFNTQCNLPFRSESEKDNYYDFIRLMHDIGAMPKVLIRYDRESFFGVNDQYARVTFDRNMCYRPTREWTLLPQEGNWWSFDSAMAMRRPFSGIILEVKTYEEVPAWVLELIRTFNLVRVGFCKYVTAMRLDSLFSGAAYSDGSETCYDD